MNPGKSLQEILGHTAEVVAAHPGMLLTAAALALGAVDLRIAEGAIKALVAGAMLKQVLGARAEIAGGTTQLAQVVVGDEISLNRPSPRKPNGPAL